ncbi:hypothetical protein H4S07_005834 [Coemansia furcata]|uniref:Uncharacterized protein n=1 Tax=Coemansia furcata TaxID=417177 RepID=A0ACC1KZI7_9FUNG|nr:hypothetical protein H4S07_005834 [Coemansia furcata]
MYSNTYYERMMEYAVRESERQNEREDYDEWDGSEDHGHQMADGSDGEYYSETRSDGQEISADKQETGDVYEQEQYEDHASHSDDNHYDDHHDDHHDDDDY